jgi:predicted DCC family thiol-disulfide oxidoreductase YuxK
VTATPFGGWLPRLLEPRTERLTVLYDGDCGFCRLSVDVLADLDLEDRLEMVPLQHAADHPERPELARIARDHPLAQTIHVRRADGRISAGGGAVLEILDALPLGWLFRPWRLLPGLPSLLDAGYQLVADNRGPISELITRFGRPLAPCDLHSPAARVRQSSPRPDG